MRSTKYYSKDKETGVIEELSLYNKEKTIHLRWNDKFKRLERLSGIKVKLSKKDRLIHRRHVNKLLAVEIT